MQNPGRPLELPPELQRFLRLVEEERYWDSHEALEGPWRRSGSDFYHGLILYASAFVHAQRGNPHGVRAQLLKARPKLERYRPEYLGLDVESILSHADACIRAVDATGPPPDLERLPKPSLDLVEKAVRGDEPELAAGG